MEPDEGVAGRSRDRRRTWPPRAAAHDGIHGRVLRTMWCRPEDYENGYDAIPTIRELAEVGLGEVDGFRRHRPDAARSIAGPLERYEELLRDVRDEPERRLMSPSPDRL